jgi:hypothetical protein
MKRMQVIQVLEDIRDVKMIDKKIIHKKRQS